MLGFPFHSTFYEYAEKPILTHTVCVSHTLQIIPEFSKLKAEKNTNQRQGDVNYTN